mgnify:CR=1 FL=1
MTVQCWGMLSPSLHCASRRIVITVTRGITTDSVRHLVNASITKTGMIDIRTLNQELDTQWPMK